jgi:hypothetical protein
MSKNKYSVAKAQLVQKAKALNTEKIEVGKKLIFVGLVEPAMKPGQDRPNDSVRFTVDGVLRNIPMSQYLQMSVNDGSSLMNNEGDETEITIPNSLTITKVTDRLNSAGEKVWPLSLYKSTAEMLGNGGRDFDYEELIADGFKPGVQAKIDAGEIDCVQDYEVSIG